MTLLEGFKLLYIITNLLYNNLKLYHQPQMSSYGLNIISMENDITSGSWKFEQGWVKKKKREKKTTTMVQVETKLSARSILMKHPGITQTVNTEVVTESRDKRYVAHREK